MHELFESDEPNEEDQIDPLVELIVKVVVGLFMLVMFLLVAFDTYLDWITIQRVWP